MYSAHGDFIETYEIYSHLVKTGSIRHLHGHCSHLTYQHVNRYGKQSILVFKTNSFYTEPLLGDRWVTHTRKLPKQETNGNVRYTTISVYIVLNNFFFRTKKYYLKCCMKSNSVGAYCAGRGTRRGSKSEATESAFVLATDIGWTTGFHASATANRKHLSSIRVAYIFRAETLLFYCAYRKRIWKR